MDKGKYMGKLLDWFGFRFEAKEINVYTESDSWLDQYKQEYLSKNEEDKDGAAALVFEEAKRLIHSFDEKQLLKEMKKQRMNVDFLTLNITQNVALVKVREGDTKDIIKQYGPTVEAKSVYNFTNDKKLELHYISPLQHDENKRLIDELSRRLF